MKILMYYLTHYYNFFISTNRDEGWAISRSVTLVLLNFFFSLMLLATVILKPIHGSKQAFDRIYDSNKLLIQLGIVIAFLAISYSLSYYAKKVFKQSIKVKSTRIDKLIVWLTLPVVIALAVLIGSL
jgi:fumarate reductase subunit C